MAEQNTQNHQTVPYQDILESPRHVSDHRPHMTNYNRAAQFAPFAALSGFEGAIRETERVTGTRVELDEDMKEQLDCQLNELLEHSAQRPWVTIEYFVPDSYKEGGAYQKVSGKIKKTDPIAKVIYLESGEAIFAREIIGISCFYPQKNVK